MQQQSRDALSLLHTGMQATPSSNEIDRGRAVRRRRGSRLGYWVTRA